jgi:hypothetical protein
MRASTRLVVQPFDISCYSSIASALDAQIPPHASPPLQLHAPPPVSTKPSESQYLPLANSNPFSAFLHSYPNYAAYLPSPSLPIQILSIDFILPIEACLTVDIVDSTYVGFDKPMDRLPRRRFRSIEEKTENYRGRLTQKTACISIMHYM